MLKKKILIWVSLFILVLVAVSIYFTYDSVDGNEEAVYVTEVDNLFLLSKVWGLMKYYHPETQGGGQTFDNDLIELIPLVRAATTLKERDALIHHWVMSYGTFPILEERPTKVSNRPTKAIDTYIDFSWIQALQMTDELRETLTDLSFANRQNMTQRSKLPYKMPSDIVFNFDYEEAYIGMFYPNDQYRLLSLFRFWNVFEYFSPNKDLLDTSWDDTLYTMIPIFLEASDQLEYEKAIRSLAKATDDGHGFVTGTQALYRELIGAYRIPVGLAWHEGQAVVTATVYRDENIHTHLKVGDVIKAINGIPIEEALEGLKFYSAASHEGAEISFALSHCLTVKSKDVTIDISRYGENLTLESVAYPLDELTYDNAQEKPALYWVNDDTLYIDYNKISLSEFDEKRHDILGSKALIIDLRGYPDTEMIYKEIIALLYPNQMTFVHFHMVDPNYLGNLYTDPYSLGTNNPHYYKGEVISLVNINTGSHTEFCAMAFRLAPKGIVIGSETIGQNGDVVAVPLVGGYEIYYSSIGVHNIDDSETQRIGILADIEVTPTVQSVIDGDDLYLQAALEYLEGVLHYQVPLKSVDGNEMVDIEKALINRPFDIAIDEENSTFTIRQAHRVWQFKMDADGKMANMPQLHHGNVMVPKGFFERELKMHLNFQTN